MLKEHIDALSKATEEPEIDTYNRYRARVKVHTVLESSLPISIVRRQRGIISV
jgi:hypothetical protein